ncbi:hypothetical protein Gogos_009588 [Gossypium gossypioides]|uniref:DUF4283 domain-containing protein n=1 Tax=Gossypium gossypioides TaxID=34282 RepID=A0A7J9BIQ0_GOSGO|nr:hypothetical protein [Gossypium gossypioides]
MEKRMVDLSIEDGEEAWLLPVRNTMANLWHPLGEVQILNLGKKVFIQVLPRVRC